MTATLFLDDDNASNAEVWEPDDWASREVAAVVLAAGFAKTLDYLIPESLTGRVVPGVRVEVPLGRGNTPKIGYCVAVARGAEADQMRGERKLKEIVQLIDDAPLLTHDTIKLARWIADYYFCPLGQVLEAVLPSGVRNHAGTRLTSVLTAIVEAEFTPSQREAFDKLTKRQRDVLATLASTPCPLTLGELARAAKCSSVPITHLKKVGLLVAQTVRRTTSDIATVETAPEPPHRLEPQQQSALDKISPLIAASEHRTILLHGVTGSGKTEVYIRAIDEVVTRGKQAIVLVPEISLTPQTVARFRSRFRRVAVLHSHLTDVERHHQWHAIKNGEIDVVVGARSAVFAPFPQLGLIVIDEEHEQTFKQDSAPRYHARAVAQVRARNADAVLILGSATPSLETYFAAERGRIDKITMLNRIGKRQMPDVKIVDLRDEVRRGLTRGAIHERLHRAIYDTLADNGQVILLLNRRGYATHIQCPACGEVVKCPRCDIALTHHKTADTAICHYCDHTTVPPRQCPGCGHPAIRYSGIGTQRLQQEIEARFPQARVVRMDADTMRGRGSHEAALADFRSGKYQILLGTQMIAKGLDFPQVTLVGVVNADTAMHIPDFRAEERTFHLVTQVAGRTGRGPRGGHVIVQTSSPTRRALVAATQHDFVGFAAEELAIRTELRYPPQESMVRFVIRGPNEQATAEFATSLASRFELVSADKLATHPNAICGRCLGPAPAPITRLHDLFRFHFHLIAPDAAALHRHIRARLEGVKTPDPIQWIIDVDPIDML
ncbi:MAG: replication restart helicase PriA [Thermoguttaceae bacterium]